LNAFSSVKYRIKIYIGKELPFIPGSRIIETFIGINVSTYFNYIVDTWYWW